MNWAPPAIATDAAKHALEDISANHYSLAKGRAGLRQQLSKQYSASFNLPGGRALDVNDEITITAVRRLPLLCWS
jgi:kynurenine aminotransferase